MDSRTKDQGKNIQTYDCKLHVFLLLLYAEALYVVKVGVSLSLENVMQFILKHV